MMMLGPLIWLLLAQPTLFQGVSRKYHFVNQLMTWSDAQAYCREHFADLATMDTQEDNNKVQQVREDSGQSLVWMGLYDDVNSWRWSIDGTWLYEAGPSPFGNWIPFAPNNTASREHCGLLGGFTIYDHTCDHICSVPVKRALKVGLNMDLKDTKVQETLLLQKEKLLKDHWHDQRFALSWKKQANGNVFNATKQ